MNRSLFYALTLALGAGCSKQPAQHPEKTTPSLRCFNALTGQPIVDTLRLLFYREQDRVPLLVKEMSSPGYTQELELPPGISHWGFIHNGFENPGLLSDTLLHQSAKIILKPYHPFTLELDLGSIPPGGNLFGSFSESGLVVSSEVSSFTLKHPFPDSLRLHYLSPEYKSYRLSTTIQPSGVVNWLVE